MTDSTLPPKISGAPETIWLVYGELEHDDTHAECRRSGEVTWCEDKQFDSDVRYVRADSPLLAEIDRLKAQVAELESKAHFYKRRCDAIQNWQGHMRDPERTVVCDILANGFTLDPPIPADRYVAVDTAMKEKP